MIRSFDISKTDLEIMTSGSTNDFTPVFLKQIKIVYPNGTEHFEIPDDAEVILTFEGDNL